MNNEEFVDWQDMKKRLADPELENMFDTTQGDDGPEPPTHDRVEKETGSETPSTAPEATSTTTHDEL